jgi:serine/threonine protein kinase
VPRLEQDPHVLTTRTWTSGRPETEPERQAELPQELATPERSGSTASGAARLSTFVASPRGVLVLVPLLVLLVGLTLTFDSQRTLGATSREMADAQLRMRTESAVLRIHDALGQSGPLLDRLLAVGAEATRLPRALPDGGLLPFALELHDLALSRPGITQCYVALPDGRFLSADRDRKNPGGALFQVTEDGVSRTYRVEGHRLRLLGRAASAYDPRERAWYRLATTRRARTWSEPYSFYFTGTPGVTAVDVVLGASGALEAVVGVDFDVERLTEFMAALEAPDLHTVVFTGSGVVLAYPRGQASLARLQGRDHVPTYREYEDPELRALVEHVTRAAGSTPRRGGARSLSYKVRGERALAVLHTLEGTAPAWHVATMTSERTALSALHEHRRTSLLVGAVALGGALLLAWGLARHILRVRAAVVRAEEAARAAAAQVRDLGSYQLLERLGQGGMGEVWRARHRLLAREAAIKLIRFDDAQSLEKRAELEERFRREARAISALRSRHTVELYDYGLTSDGTLYYVMELLDGIDLQKLIEQYGAQPAERVRRILMQACSSLAEAHEAGLIHRDVKPANLFLGRAAEEVDVLKVLDFGLVLTPLEAAAGPNPAVAAALEAGEAALEPAEAAPRPGEVAQGLGEVALEEGALSSAQGGAPPPPGLAATALSDSSVRLTRADAQLGSPPFMSPEHVLGQELDGRADLYALGCVGFWLLTGRVPFTGSSAIAVMLQHMQAPVPDLRALARPSVSVGLTDLITSCLQKNRDNRPASASALADALDALGPEAEPWDAARAATWWATNVAPPRRTSLSRLPPPVAELVRSDP